MLNTLINRTLIGVFLFSSQSLFCNTADVGCDQLEQRLEMKMKVIEKRLSADRARENCQEHFVWAALSGLLLSYYIISDIRKTHRIKLSNVPNISLFTGFHLFEGFRYLLRNQRLMDELKSYQETTAP
jgi:hypothetical protein